jgi:hypothetical protein
VGYVPDGMSKEQYQKLLQKEKEASKGKNLGAYGPQSFTSRSLQAFQKDLEQGKAGHLMPVMNAKELLKKGKIKQEDIPYMQVSLIVTALLRATVRGGWPPKQRDILYSQVVSIMFIPQRLGSWDNSDLGKKNAKKGNENDEKYNKTINAAPTKFDWTGRGTRTGPAQPKKNEEKPKGKLFGLF